VSKESYKTILKISAAKSKAMALRINVKNTKWGVKGMNLEWVKVYQYLGECMLHTFQREI